MASGIRVAVGQFNELTEEKLRFAAQIGVSGIQLNAPKLPGEARWEEKDLKDLVDRTRAHGLVLEAIENVPVHFYDEVMLGLPGRDEQIENYRHILRSFGRVGIPILGFHFMPNSVWRTDRMAHGSRRRRVHEVRHGGGRRGGGHRGVAPVPADIARASDVHAAEGGR